MDTENICPSCRKTLPPDVPLGLCPECLMKSGFATGSPEESAARFVPPTVEEIARLFPQLEILGFIGKGGMGAVYKARQPALDRFVALKVLPPGFATDPGFAERFNREARALARLSHPNIVAIHDFGQAGGLHYLLMEYVDGTNLREIERAGRLSPDQALSIVPQICEALQFAHNEGIVHRDIKPENLLLDKKGRLKITDFGIAKMLGLTAAKEALTGAKDVVGTPHYMAPEQVERPQTVDHRADIYSLGVVFYEMLTGELPLGKFSPPSKKVEVDVRLDEVVLHTLEKEPERRYQQASQLKTDVEHIATTAAPSAPGFGAGAAPATQGIPHSSQPGASDKTILPAFLLAFFFGVFGAHRFYVGKIRTAILQLGMFVGSVPLIIFCSLGLHGGPHFISIFLVPILVLSCLLIPAVAIWATVDWILLLCKVFTDGQGRRITQWVHANGGSSQPPRTGIPPPTTPASSGQTPPGMPPTPPGSSGNIPGGTPPVPPPASGRTPGGGTGKIVAPGIALMVVGSLKLLGALKSVVFFAGPGADWLHSFVPGLDIFSSSQWKAMIMVDAAFKMITGLLILFGGYQMVRRQSYAWSVAAGIISIVACSLLGFPVGIWALVILGRQDVKLLFDVNRPFAPAARPNKAFSTGFVVLIVAVLLFLAVLGGGAFLAVRAMANSRTDRPEPSEESLKKDGIYRQGKEFRKESSQSFPLDANGQFSIDDVNGQINIQGWSSNLVVVDTVIHGKTGGSVAAVKIDVDSDPSRAAIHTKLPSDGKGFSSLLDLLRNDAGNANVDYTIRLPQHARLENASLIDGTVFIDGMADDITASTVNGTAEVKNAARNLKLSTVNGTITADMARLGAGQSADLNTVNGHIKLALPDNADAKFSITAVNGDLSSAFPELSVKKQFPVGSRLEGSLGGGAGNVEVKAVNGTIEILKTTATNQVPEGSSVVKPAATASNSTDAKASAK